MTELYDAAEVGDLERVTLLVEQGVDKNQVGGDYGDTALSAAAVNNHLAVVQYLVQQGADIDKGNTNGAGLAPLHYATARGHFEIIRYLLEQGADRDKSNCYCYTPLHIAAERGRLEIAKLLMLYGADLNARTQKVQLPIDIANTEEIRQAIRDEPRRRMDEAPGKRATEQDRHLNAATPAHDEEQEQNDEQVNKRPRLDEGSGGVEGKLAEEDEDSEPSDQEDN